MPNPSSIISSRQQLPSSNIFSSSISVEMGMLTPILQELMNDQDWVYLGDDIRQKDQQEAFQLQQIAAERHTGLDVT